eukprot:COSAG05_NODE_314_length_11610_cov_17.223265_2_plen_132_part_00
METHPYHHATQLDYLISRLASSAWRTDMLEVGNFFDDFGDAEGRTNFALWCLMKSPVRLPPCSFLSVTARLITFVLILLAAADPGNGPDQHHFSNFRDDHEQGGDRSEQGPPRRAGPTPHKQQVAAAEQAW